MLHWFAAHRAICALIAFVVVALACPAEVRAASTLVSQGSTLWQTAGLGAATCSGCHGANPGAATSGHREASNNPAKITAILTCAAGGSCAGVTGGTDVSGGQMAGADFTTLQGNTTNKVLLSLYIGQFKTPSGGTGSLTTRVNVAAAVDVGALIPTTGVNGAPQDTGGVTATNGTNGTTSVADASISGSSVIRNITYTPSAGFVGSDSFTYTLTNPTGSSGPHTVNVTVVGVTSAATASGRTNNAFSYSITTNGTTAGANPYSVTGTLPSGVTLDTATGIISGTPAAGAAGSYPITVTVSTTAGSVSQAVTITIVGVTSANAIAGTQGAAIATYTITTNGTTSGANPYSVSAGTLPANLVLDTTNGQITGTATNGGTTNVTLSVVTTVGTVSLPVTINMAFAGTPAITGPATASGAVGTAITAVQLVATNPVITAYNLVSGMPPGLSLAAGSGQITGTPTQSQASGNSNVFNVLVNATNGAGTGGNATLAFTINPSVAPTLSTATLTPSQNVAFNYDVRAGNVTNMMVAVPITGFSATGLPTGLSINAAGVISGTPTVSGGPFTAQITATNTFGTSASAAFTFNITPTAVPLISAPTAVTGTIGTPITPVSIVASNPPITAYGGTGLPPGITVDPTTGSISGTPTANGTFNALLTATNAAGPGSLAVTFTIAAVPPGAGAATMTVPLNTATTLDLAPFITGTSITGVRIVTNPSFGTVTTSGTRVTYTPRNDYFGSDAFTYAAFGTAGESAPGTVTVNIVGRPDPTRQQNVIGAVNAQIQAAQQFARTQISNFSRRLESLHRGGRTTSAAQSPGRAPVVAQAPRPADPFGEALPDAVVSRLAEDATAASANGAVDPWRTPLARDAGRGVAPGFASIPFPGTSAAPSGARGTRAQEYSMFADAAMLSTTRRDVEDAPLRINGGGLASDLIAMVTSRSVNVAQLSGGGASAQPSNTIGAMEFWIEGSVNFGNRGPAASGGSVDFSTTGLSFGVDRRLSDTLVVGIGVGVARDKTEIGADGTKSIAKGASIAVYGSYQPTPNTFIDALVGAGTLNFDTDRFVAPLGSYAKSDRDGTQIFASVAAGYELRRSGMLWSPYGRVDVSYDRLKDGTETGVGNFALHYFGQNLHSVQGALGLRVESVHATSFGWMVPRARIELRHSFDGDQISQIAYADQIAGQRYAISSAAVERNALAIGIGGDFHLRNGLSLGLDYQLQKSYPEGSSQGIRLRLTQALDGKGARRPLYERDPESGGGAPHHDSSNIRIDAGMTYDDNVTRGRLSTETLRDTSVNLAANKVAIFPLTDNVRLMVVGTVGGDRFHSYNGLDRLFGSVRGELQYRGSAEFGAPILAAFGRFAGEQFESKLRRGYRYSAGVSIRQPITDRILAFGALAHNERFAKSDVFDARDNSLQLNLDYAWSNDSTLYLAGEYRRGDVVSSGSGSLENIDIAKVFVLDDAFTATQTFAYKVDADTSILTLGYNLSFGTRDSLDLSWRRARSTPTLRPGFNAAGPWHYTADQFSIVYLVRF